MAIAKTSHYHCNAGEEQGISGQRDEEELRLLQTIRQCQDWHIGRCRGMIVRGQVPEEACGPTCSLLLVKPDGDEIEMSSEYDQ